MPLTALRKRLSASMLSFRLKRIGAQKKRGSSPQLWRITSVIPAALAIAVAGCASDGGAGKQGRNLGELGLQQLVLPAAPPLIEAQDAEDVDRAKRLAARYDRRRLERQRRTRLIEAVQTPLLYEAPAGQRFLSAPGARALAIGYPPRICPAIGLATSTEPAPRAETAASALNGCLAKLEQSGASDECGCRLVALDDTLLAEQAAFAYARGVTAQFVGGEKALATTLIAEERSEEDGSGDVRIWFLDALGPRAVARLTEAGEAELAVLEGPNGDLSASNYYRGRWESEGFRRGRLAEKLYLEDEDGERLIALIGYSPAELAAREDELEVWYD